MGKRIKAVVLIIIPVVIFVVGFLFFVTCPKQPKRFAKEVGVWCWNDTVSDDELAFAKDNGVTEIYYSNSSFDEASRLFIQRANSYGIEVYLLCGSKKWVENWQPLADKIQQYIEFNNNNPSTAFKGIHLDVEPHQFDDFESRREYYLERYVAFVKEVCDIYSTIAFDFDIPFWFDDKVTFQGENKEVYKFVIDCASRVFVMSYRDEAEKIVSVAKDELEYAKATNKKLFVSVETGASPETPQITFYEEGKEYMYEQLRKLNSLVDDLYGLSIHHLASWYSLKT